MLQIIIAQLGAVSNDYFFRFVIIQFFGQLGKTDGTVVTQTLQPSLFGAEHGVVIKKPTKIAAISVGYYHGFGIDRHNSERSFIDRFLNRFRGMYVRVNGKRAKVLGNVGMMHTLIDVTSIDCSVGDIAILDADPVNVKGLPREYL